jgi:prepilin-type N-terminal cleavage/methylation domain-containing protein
LRTLRPSRRLGAGYSLVELLIVLAILAVLASIAVTTLSSGRSQSTAREAAQRIAADLAFAQADAIACHAARIVTFDAAAESYGVYDGTGLLLDPISHRSFVVDLAGLFPGAGLDLASPNFSGAASVTFDASGTPAAGGEVELHAGGEGWKVCVSSLTGRITIENLPPAQALPVVE